MNLIGASLECSSLLRAKHLLNSMYGVLFYPIQYVNVSIAGKYTRIMGCEYCSIRLNTYAIPNSHSPGVHHPIISMTVHQ